MEFMNDLLEREAQSMKNFLQLISVRSFLLRNYTIDTTRRHRNCIFTEPAAKGRASQQLVGVRRVYRSRQATVSPARAVAREFRHDIIVFLVTAPVQTTRHPREDLHSFGSIGSKPSARFSSLSKLAEQHIPLQRSDDRQQQHQPVRVGDVDVEQSQHAERDNQRQQRSVAIEHAEPQQFTEPERDQGGDASA